MANNQPYNSGSVAYKYDAVPAEPKRRVDVIPGGGKDRASVVSPSHALALRVAKLTVAAVLVFAFVGFVRVSLNAATVAEALEAREVSSLLEDSRSSISELEVMQSSLSNPTRIKAEAALLGMGSPESTSVLDLSGDIVATDGEGNLSLSGSLDALAAVPA